MQNYISDQNPGVGSVLPACFYCELAWFEARLVLCVVIVKYSQLRPHSEHGNELYISMNASNNTQADFQRIISDICCC